MNLKNFIPPTRRLGSEEPFQRALAGFNNILINLSSKKFNWVSMSKIPSPKRE